MFKSMYNILVIHHIITKLFLLPRISLITVYHVLKNDLTEDVRELLSTLVEICELAYSSSDKRSSKSILRLFNITFKHAVLLTQLFPKEPKKISKQKLFGIYFHSITCHLPEVS